MKTPQSLPPEHEPADTRPDAGSASEGSAQFQQHAQEHSQADAQQPSPGTGAADGAQEADDLAMDADVRLGWWLDNCVRLPGGFRIGLDGVLGLVPGLGDLAGAGLSSWVIYRAYRRGAPLGMLCKMVFNVLIDTTIGTIPLLGDLFDFAWKANQRNAALLQKHLQKQHLQKQRR